MDDATCFHCGAPATLLCDYLLGHEARARRYKRGSLRSPWQGWYWVTDGDGRTFTCDRPLCEACATNKGVAFFCGSGGCEVVTRDYCREHAEAGDRGRMAVITEAEAEVMRGQLPGGFGVVHSDA